MSASTLVPLADEVVHRVGVGDPHPVHELAFVVAFAVRDLLPAALRSLPPSLQVWPELPFVVWNRPFIDTVDFVPGVG